MSGAFHWLLSTSQYSTDAYGALSRASSSVLVSGDAALNGPQDVWNGRSLLLRANLLAAS